MKKMLLIAMILIFIALILLVSSCFKIINGKLTFNVEKLKGLYIARGKYYGLDQEVRQFITPTDPAIESFVEQNLQVSKLSLLGKIAGVYNFVQTNYKYVLDDKTSYTNGEYTIYGAPDLWLHPIEFLATYHQNQKFSGDCEDVSFFTETSLLKVGVTESYACIGTVSIIDPQTDEVTGTYGHAWVIVKYNGQWCLLENTLQETLKELRPVNAYKYAKYNPSIMFNADSVNAVIGTDFNKDIEQPPLPPAKIQDLKDALKN